jgi:hypothetical protein
MSQPGELDTPAQGDQPEAVQSDVQADAAQPQAQAQASGAVNDVASEEQRRQAEERRKRAEEQRARRRRQAATGNTQNRIEFITGRTAELKKAPETAPVEETAQAQIEPMTLATPQQQIARTVLKNSLLLNLVFVLLTMFMPLSSSTVFGIGFSLELVRYALARSLNPTENFLQIGTLLRLAVLVTFASLRFVSFRFVSLRFADLLLVFDPVAWMKSNSVTKQCSK